MRKSIFGFLLYLGVGWMLGLWHAGYIAGNECESRGEFFSGGEHYSCQPKSGGK